MSLSSIPSSQLIKKFDDEDEYDFYSLTTIVNELSNDISKARSLRFVCNSPKIIIKFSISEHEKCIKEIIGTAANMGITCLYRPIREKKCGWRPLDSAATRHDVCGLKLEMVRYEILEEYEVLIYFPISAKIKDTEIGVIKKSDIELCNTTSDSIYLLGNMQFENGINTAAFYLPNIISRRTDLICKNYAGNNVFDIRSISEEQLKNIKYVIIGMMVFNNNVEDMLTNTSKLIESIEKFTEARIIVFKSPMIFYNNHQNAQKINEFFEKNNDSRLLYLQMADLENQMFLYDCTLSCNFLNDYGYICLGQKLSEAINRLEAEKNG